MKLYDLSLGEEPDGSTMLHRVDCPHVRKLAADGHPVISLFGCQGAPPDIVPKHSCLTDSPWRDEPNDPTHQTPTAA